MKNTNECANIYLVGVQKSGTEESKTELFAQGGFYRKNDAYYIVYKEDNGTNNFLKITRDAVTVQRMGEMSSVMHLSEGDITDFDYKTPFGNIKMQVKTAEIINELSDKGGILGFSYTLYTGGDELENRITLDVKLRSDNG